MASSILISRHLFLYPCHEYGHGILLSLISELSSCRDVVPLCKAATATTACSVLSQEYGMTSHGSLLSVIWDVYRCQPFGNKVLCVLADSRKPFLFDVFLILIRQVKLTTQVRFSYVQTSPSHQTPLLLRSLPLRTLPLGTMWVVCILALLTWYSI